MRLLYNFGICFYAAALRVVAPFNHKARLMVRGHRRIFHRLAEAIGPRGSWEAAGAPGPHGKLAGPRGVQEPGGLEGASGAGRPDGKLGSGPQSKVIWFHAASLGEFEQGRPVIEQVRAQHPEYKILLTFFSPSGYEIRKDYPGADWIFYLPLDTPRAARRFVRAVRPQIAVFIKYEFWLNLLRELERSGCRTYLISAIFRPGSVFFRWYGGIYRRALAGYETIFVQRGESAALLASIGVTRAVEAGDTRFDRVAAIAAAAADVPAVERFRGGARLLVAGSTWPRDEQLLEQLFGRFPDMKMVIVPHETDHARIDRLVDSLPVPAVRYTQVAEAGDLSADGLREARVMVVDTIGLLSSIYRYAYLAYIGGGFGVGIHNTLEAATYGIPVAFGPNYQKFREARQMVDEGCAVSVATSGELELWISSFYNDQAAYERLCRQAAAYVASNRGATDAIMQRIFG